MQKICIILLLLLVSCKKVNQSGCTDIMAINFNPSATFNKGDCIYRNTSIIPVSSWDLPQAMQETSGLIIWNDKIWTINDSEYNNLYSFNAEHIESYQAYSLSGIVNTDWEEISQDENYIYIGDFGNNEDGNRKDLKIYRIEKISVLTNTPIIDTIHFTYPDQTDYYPKGLNNTDFDCEAFLVSSDSIYLFTKEWISQGTSVYSLPKKPGNFIATYSSSYHVQGLITGASYMEKEKLVVLCGYSSLLKPFLYLLYDFEDHDFFSGNKRKININLPYHQVEGITTIDGLRYYISNEYFSYSSIITPQKLHLISLRAYLSDYLSKFSD